MYDNVEELIKIIDELNDFYHDHGGDESEYPFSLTTWRWFSKISYWDNVIYKDYDDEREIVGDDYESIRDFLVREANKINNERNSVVWI